MTKKTKLYGGIYKSKEEWYFSWFLDELKDKGYIESYSYEVESVKLCNPVKIGKKTLLRELSYTYDFLIKWTNNVPNIIVCDINDFAESDSIFVMQDKVSKIEIKADYDQNNMTRLVKQVIKMTYHIHNEYVNLIKIPKLFSDTFTPKKYLLTDTGINKRKLNYKPILLTDYLKPKAS